MKSDEQIINEALNSTGVIPDTRANLILCKKILEIEALNSTGVIPDTRASLILCKKILEIKEKEMLDEQIKFLDGLLNNEYSGIRKNNIFINDRLSKLKQAKKCVK